MKTEFNEKQFEKYYQEIQDEEVGEIQLEMKSYDVVFKQYKRTLINRIRANRYRKKLDTGLRDKNSLKSLKERWFLGERVLQITWTKETDLDMSEKLDHIIAPEVESSIIKVASKEISEEMNKES